MNLKIVKPQDWVILAEDFHWAVFGKIKPATKDRIDYTMLVEQDEIAQMYITCRELDSETVYWQFGGSLPPARGSIKSYRAYVICIEWAAMVYKRISTLIDNTNKVMLKAAASVGFKIVGVKNLGGTILLDHVLEFKGV